MFPQRWPTCCTLTNATNQTTSTTNQRISLPTTCWIEVSQLICFHRQVTAGCYGADSEGWFDPWALLQVPFHICGVINTRWVPIRQVSPCWFLMFPVTGVQGVSPTRGGRVCSRQSYPGAQSPCWSWQTPWVNLYSSFSIPHAFNLG